MADTHSVKLYVIPVNRFSSYELPHFKLLIGQHKKTLNKLGASSDWRGVRAELVKASSTLRQLQRSLRDLEDVRLRLEETQRDDFETLFKPVRQNTKQLMKEFSDFQEGLEAAVARRLPTPAADPGGPEPQPEPDGQRQLLLQEQQLVLERQQQLEQYSTIERDSAGLHEIFADLRRLTQEQAEHVDAVETNVEEAQTNVAEGTRQLALAARLSGAVAPAAGALIGGLLAGPLGLLAGAKIGGLAAVGGGLLGYAGGRAVNAGRRRSTGAADPAQEHPAAARRSPSAPDRPPSAESALARLRVALARRLAAWLGRPCRLPEQPVDPVLADDVEEALEAMAALPPPVRL